MAVFKCRLLRLDHTPRPFPLHRMCFLDALVSLPFRLLVVVYKVDFKIQMCYNPFVDLEYVNMGSF